MLTQQAATVAFGVAPRPGSDTLRPFLRNTGLIVIAALGYFGICVALWRSGARGGEAYVVVPSAVEGTKAPGWLSPAEVARVNALGRVVRGRSILDPDLTRDLAACYLESPWVARVMHIRRAYPNRLDVALVIRRPFAAVQRAAGPAVILDRTGIRLPASAEGEGLPVLDGVVTAPPAPGERWDDVRVLDALRVLERYGEVVKGDLVQHFGARSVNVRKWSRPDARPIVTIETRRGFPVIWGIDLPSGEATITGPSAGEKLAWLAQAFPALIEGDKKISYLSVRQRNGPVVKLGDEGAPDR
jgi:cell division septal protein FtsQ